MKLLFSTLLLLPRISLITGMGLVSFHPPVAGVNGLPLGSAIPKAAVAIKDVSGKEISLQQVKQANGLLVMFSCNTCPYVIRNQSRTKAVCTYAGSHQVGVILLNANEGEIGRASCRERVFVGV